MIWPSSTQTSHLNGLITLVRLRGGFEYIKTDRQLQRVVVWADTLHAATHDSLPRLELTQGTTHDERTRFLGFVNHHKIQRIIPDNALPLSLHNIFLKLQTLASARSRFKTQAADTRTQQWRLTYSDYVFGVEHQILQLGHVSPPATAPHVRRLEAIKAATLIFTFAQLRDIAVTATFFAVLARRLRNALWIMDDDASTSHREKVSFSVCEPVLLWLYVHGWRASAVEGRETDREFFRENALGVCIKEGIGSEQDLRFWIEQVAWLPVVDRQVWVGIYADIERWAADHGDIRGMG